MNIVEYPNPSQWPELCRRNIPADDTQVSESVRSIIDDVAQRGDAALKDYALRFDHTTIDNIQLTQQQIDDGAALVPADIARAIDNAASNIRAFHQAQCMQPIQVETTPGVICIQRQVPIQRVGLYIPGGRAPLFSTVLMLGIPAQIAGCTDVALCTPRSQQAPIKPEILYAAKLCGIRTIYQVGGAQAIAAMAYGTETIRQVDKIFGPGNRYVTRAKQMVSTMVAIDMPAGPSEVMVMADDSANPQFVAADMLSQAEHGPDSQAIMVTDSPGMAKAVYQAVERQMQQLTRKLSIEASIASSHIITLKDRQQMIAFANAYASEHLIISMREPWQVADLITSAGSVFIGNYAPESAGDYASGTNHTLPTAAWARSYSGVNIDSFTKKITYQQISRQGLQALAPTITTMAMAEGLDAHAAAVNIRIAEK